MHRMLAVVLFGLSLLIQSQTVFADSIPYPAELDWRAKLFTGTWGMHPGYRSDDAACQAVYADSYNAKYVTYLGVVYTIYGYARGDCRFFDTFTGVGREEVAKDMWDRTGSCPKGGSVTDPWALQPMCSCPAGWMFPPGGAVYGRPPCILDTCQVPPLKSYSPDPFPARVDELSPRTADALKCLQATIGSQGGTSSFTSGYRPAPYNAHLIAVWDKLQELNNYKGPEDCATRRADVMAEIDTHKMKVRPDPNSPHTFHEAFDLSSSL